MDANFIVVGKLLTIQITINPVIKDWLGFAE